MNIYKKHLTTILAGHCGMNNGQISCVLQKFDALAHRQGNEAAFRECNESYASGDTDKALAYINQEMGAIERELNRLNDTVKLDTNPATRLDDKIKRFNTLIERGLDIEVSNIDNCGTKIVLTKEAKDKLKLTRPSWLPVRSFNYTSEAKEINGRTTKFELEIYN